MAKIARIAVKDQNPITSLHGFFKTLLREGEISALLIPQHLPGKSMVMPTLVTDPEKLQGADPLAPVFPINAAKATSKLTRKPAGGRIAAVLRPCEIRAFIELVKLKQGSMDDVVVIGSECYGAYSNTDYIRFASGEGMGATLRFYENIREGKGTASDDFDLSPACKACEYPIPDKADVTLATIGIDLRDSLVIAANTPQGEVLLDKFPSMPVEESEERKNAISDLLAQRIAYRDALFDRTSAATADLEKLMSYLGNCVNCYNCRVACPVCYCKECVFVTDVFDHEPSQYLRWAKRKGILKMPTDTTFYHLTRMAHMSLSCIGCGQCSNACPNDVPVAELFRTIAGFTQRAFSYQAGRSLEDEPPLSAFREKEFSEVTGGRD